MAWLAEMTFIDWIGVLGSLVISAAYFGVSTARLDGESPLFQLLNLTGAVMILASLYYRPNAGAIMIEVLWISIALYSLGKYYLRRS